MQYKLFLTLFLSSLALSTSAAPIPELSKGEPILQRTPEPEPGCKMYTCFCAAPNNGRSWSFDTHSPDTLSPPFDTLAHSLYRCFASYP
ncbi:hypothetical protein DFH09DRAFT_1369408 [Mycena vulgaris]|nr:hypothetical protein DFH09DRAFT_1369408 [Mycena vulgaris]